jgi:hypothetical protein
MRVDLIAVPYDFGRPGERMGAGPERLLEAGLSWPHLSAAIPGFEPVPEESVAFIGARDLDPLEAALALGVAMVDAAARRRGGAVPDPRMRRDP